MQTKIFQPSIVVLWKTCLKIFRKIHWKTPVLEFLFFKKNDLIWNSITKKPFHRRFIVNIAKFLRAPILQNICKQLLLEMQLSRTRVQSRPRDKRIWCCASHTYWNVYSNSNTWDASITRKTSGIFQVCPWRK